MQAEKHPGGRPTKYTPELLSKAQEYLATCTDTYDVVEYGRTGGQLVWHVKLPSVAGLAIFLGLSRSRVYEYAEIYPEFKDILEAVLAEQEHRLITEGLGGNYNATIAKLVLGKHGYKEQASQEHTGKDGGPIAFVDMASDDREG